MVVDHAGSEQLVVGESSWRQLSERTGYHYPVTVSINNDLFLISNIILTLLFFIQYILIQELSPA